MEIKNKKKERDEEKKPKGIQRYGRVIRST